MTAHNFSSYNNVLSKTGLMRNRFLASTAVGMALFFYGVFG